MNKIAEIAMEDRVYIDETGIDNNDEYSFAWGPIGERVYGLKKARKTQRLNIIAGLQGDNITASFVFEGYCTQKIFNTYAKQVLAKELKAGKTVILDNASFHKSPELEKIIGDVGCNILYLPPYSPDFNRIEKRWFGIKNAFRKLIPKFDGDLEKCAEEVFKAYR